MTRGRNAVANKGKRAAVRVVAVVVFTLTETDQIPVQQLLTPALVQLTRMGESFHSLITFLSAKK